MVKQGPQNRRRIGRESKWVRISSNNQSLYVQNSKFLEAGSELRASELEMIWGKLSLQEKLDLCAAYHAKPVITKEGEYVLDIVMRKGDEITWSNIVSVLARHTERHRVLAFVGDRIERQAPPLANFYHTAELLGDSALVPRLLEKHREYELVGISPESTDRIRSIDYLSCTAALWKLTRLHEYKKTIQNYLVAKDILVRDSAKNLLHRCWTP